MQTRRMIPAAVAAMLFLVFAAGAARAQSSMWVTGYYPYWAMDDMPPSQMNWTGLTHVVHFFARPENSSPYFGPAFNSNDSGELIWGTDQGHAVGEQSNPDSLIKYAHMHGVKVVLSVGGIYGGQDAIVDFISQDQGRTTTWIQAAGTFCKKYGYDGLELDWESPKNATQVNRIISTMRTELDSWPVHGTLVVAAPGWNFDADVYNSSIGMIDQYNIMGYDLHRPSNLCCNDVGAAGVSGFNAALHRADAAMYPIVSAISDNYDGIAADATEDNGQLIIGSDRLRFGPKYCIQKLGWNPKKVGMGIPFYGWMFKDVTAPNQKVSTSTTYYMQYERANDALTKGGTYHFDAATQTPWVGGTTTATITEPWRFTISAGTKFYMTYDDTNSVKAKVAWAKDLGIGGMMIYALDEGWNAGASGAKKDPLLRALASAMNNSGPPVSWPYGTLTASPAELPIEGGTVQLSWTSGNATQASIDHGVGTVPVNGSVSVEVTATTVFVLTLSNENGQTTSSATVTVEGLTPDAPDFVYPATGATNVPTSVTLRWDKCSIAAGYHVQLSRDSTFATCKLNDSSLVDTARQVTSLAKNVVFYRHVRARNADGQWGEFSSITSFRTGSTTTDVDEAGTLPLRTRLVAAYPNPFNPSTTVTFELEESQDIRLAVYDLLGREIATLLEEHRPAGRQQVSWNASGHASGVYLVRLSAGRSTDTQRILLVK